MVETKDCEYVFYWKTPSGCAVVNSPVENCTVYDKQYGFYFDLSKLKGDLYSQKIKTNVDYNVEFCGTPASCNSKPDKKDRSCFVNGKSEVFFAPPQVLYVHFHLWA